MKVKQDEHCKILWPYQKSGTMILGIKAGPYSTPVDDD